VAIYRLLQFSAFQPEEITCMTTAYEDALRVLRLADRQDPITELVAKKIIEAAQTGERDPRRLREKVWGGDRDRGALRVGRVNSASAALIRSQLSFGVVQKRRQARLGWSVGSANKNLTVFRGPSRAPHLPYRQPSKCARTFNDWLRRLTTPLHSAC
jgi:hypothetical protein